MLGVKNLDCTMDDDSTGLECRILTAINPIIEVEIERRLKERQMMEVLEWKKKYQVLHTKHVALQQEMQRSRQIFEDKCKEWRALKEVLSQKERLKSAVEKERLKSTLSNILSDPSNKEALSQKDSLKSTLSNILSDPSNKEALSQKECLDSALGKECLKFTLEKQSVQESSDPLAFLADAVSTQGPSPRVASDPILLSPIKEDLSIQSPAKRKSPQYLEPMRSKGTRKVAHAKDCLCCTRFYDVVGVGDTDERQRHIQEISRHRFQYEPPATPPGFWDVNFTHDKDL